MSRPIEMTLLVEDKPEDGQVIGYCGDWPNLCWKTIAPAQTHGTIVQEMPFMPMNPTNWLGGSGVGLSSGIIMWLVWREVQARRNGK